MPYKRNLHSHSQTTYMIACSATPTRNGYHYSKNLTAPVVQLVLCAFTQLRINPLHTKVVGVEKVNRINPLHTEVLQTW